MAIRHRPHLFKAAAQAAPPAGPFTGSVQAGPARQKRANVLAEELLTRGCMFVEKQVWDEAQNEFRKALQMEPDYAEAHNNLGVCLLYAGNPQEATLALKEALAHFPNWPMAEANLGLAMQRSGDIEQAITYYRKALSRQKNQPSVWVALADSLAATTRLTEAQAAYEQALALLPQYAHARYRLGVLLTRCNKLDEAEEALKQALELDPNHGEALAALGAFAARRGQLKSAQESFTRALSGGGVPAPAQRGLHRLQVLRQGLERGAAELLAAAPKEHNLARCYFNLGLAQYRAGQAAAAKESFCRAAETSGEGAAPLLWAGLCAALEGDGGKARSQWQEALKLEPENAWLREQLGYLALGMGLQKESEAHFAEAQKRGRTIPAEQLK